jgi:alpha-galactosidase
MAATVDYVHSRGLRVGIYTAPHAATCGGYTGSLNHEAIDAATFVAWGIDAVKLDAGCRNDASLHDGTLLASIARFRDALNATGKPVLLYVDDGNPISGAKVPRRTV